jgi:hypothetical protein
MTIKYPFPAKIFSIESAAMHASDASVNWRAGEARCIIKRIGEEDWGGDSVDWIIK